MTFGSDILDPQIMYPNVFGDHMTFPVAYQLVNICTYPGKHLYFYKRDWYKC